MIEQAEIDEQMMNLESLTEPIKLALLNAENQRLIPLMDELRINAEQAWNARIQREMGQLAEAEWRTQQDGGVPDPRWIRMKNGLISRLHDDLARRLMELDDIQNNLSGELKIRAVIRIV